MSFLDKAKDLLNQHDDKVDQALDKGGEAAKGRFAGHEGHIDQGVDRAQAMTGDGDTTAPHPEEHAPDQPGPGRGEPARGEPEQAPPPQQ